MSRKSFVAKEHIAELNDIKKELLGSRFSFEDLHDMLRNNGILCCRLFFRSLLEVRIIVSDSDGLYYFPDKNAIHYSKLENAYNFYKTHADRYIENWKFNKIPVAEVEEIEPPLVLAAIAYLQSRGYTVLKTP